MIKKRLKKFFSSYLNAYRTKNLTLQSDTREEIEEIEEILEDPSSQVMETQTSIHNSNKNTSITNNEKSELHREDMAYSRYNQINVSE